LTPPPTQTPAPRHYFEPQSLSYDDFKRRYPQDSRFNPNHYAGDEGYANYGYMRINECWVDPESEGEVYDAITGRLGASYTPELPVGITPVPRMTEEDLYWAFVHEVSYGEDGDGEGDPRASYISPATFTRWAAGVTRGDHYVVEKVPPQVRWALLALILTIYLSTFW
jgi:hypothetical protein